MANDKSLFTEKFAIVGVSSTGGSLRAQSDAPGYEDKTFNIPLTTGPALTFLMQSEAKMGQGYAEVTWRGEPTVLGIPGTDGVSYSLSNVRGIRAITEAEYDAAFGITAAQDSAQAVEGLSGNKRAAELRSVLVQPAALPAMTTADAVAAAIARMAG